MMAYVGQSRSTQIIARLQADGVGEMFTAGQDYWPPRRTPFAVDCGTFGPWRRGEEWQEGPFLQVLSNAHRDGMTPDWVVAPDIIGGGVASLRLSLKWQPALSKWRVLLAVQDGMHGRQVAKVLHLFAGLFVGGTLDWKIKTSREWVKLAHRHGKMCHIGRVGIPRRVRWAQRIGADSIDSCQPLWSKENLNRWVKSLGYHPQRELFKGVG